MGNVKFSDISKGFGAAPVLQRVSLDIEDGEFVTLLGPSGCGKSTLLRILAGLETQDAGTVTIAGRQVDSLRPKARDIAMVFQSYALYPHMTVAANMGLPLRMRWLNAWQRLPLIGAVLPGTRKVRADIQAEVSRTAEALSIAHLLERKPGQLSGGQRQRVAVGRAMVRHPAVFLMDEPLSNLDAKLRMQMRAEIKGLHRRLGVTFIYVTHDQSEAMTMSDRVAVMLDGQVLQVAPPRTIYADPDNREVAEFIGSPKINLIEAVSSEDGMVRAANAVFAVPGVKASDRVTLIGIRPEALCLTQASDITAFAGRVYFTEHLGSDLFIHVSVPGIAAPLIARLPAEGASEPAVGQMVNLSVRADQILLFSEEGQRVRPAASVKQLRGYVR